MPEKNTQNVVMIVSHFSPPVTGGEIYNKKLFEYLKEKFTNTHLLTIYDCPVVRSELVRILPNIWHLKIIFEHLIRGYEKTIIIENIDRCSDLLLLNVFSTILNKICKKKIHLIPLVHHPTSVIETNKFKKYLKFSHESFIYQNSKKIIVTSGFTAEKVEQWSKGEKDILVAYPGPNVPYKESKSEDKNNLNVLFVGSVTERKGVDILVKSFKLLLKEYESLHLDIIGTLDKEKDYSNKIKNICLEEINNGTVSIHGKISNDKLISFYQNADIFVLPSKWEGFGMVLAEAMLYKLPIVATRVAAIPYLVKDGKNGYLVCPDDINDLAGAVKKLIDNKTLRNEMGELNHREAQQYNWDETFTKIEHFITQ
jgi:glycosyltransferase involved in cell wall biosynthesis